MSSVSRVSHQEINLSKAEYVFAYFNSTYVEYFNILNLATLGSLLGVCPEEGVESERAVHVEPARGQLRQPDLQPVEPVARRAVRRPQGLIYCSQDCSALWLVVLFYVGSRLKQFHNLRRWSKWI